MKKLSNKIAYILTGIVLAIGFTVYAANVSIPQSTGKGNYISGLASGNYQTNTACSNGQILAASSTSSSGWACVANTASLGATTTITSNILINGPSFTFATGTPDTNLGLLITGAGSTITFQPQWSGVLSVARGGTATNTLASLTSGSSPN